MQLSKQPGLAAVIIAGILVCISCCTSRADEAWKGRLRVEAPKAWLSISGAARRLQLERLHHAQGGTASASSKTVAKSSGDNCLFLRTSVNADGKSGSQQVWCRNSHYSFQLERADPQKTWVVRRVGRTPDESIDKFIYELLNFNSFFKQQLLVATEYLPDLLASDRFILDTVEPVQHGSDVLVSVSFRYSPLTGARDAGVPLRWPAFGKVSLNPHLAWSVQEYDVEVRTKDGRAERWNQHNRFSPLADGIPFLKDRELVIQAAGKPMGTISESINDAQVGEIPEDQFKLSAFGLPEVEPPSLFPLSGLALLLVAAGVVCLVIAILIRRRKQGA